MENIELALRLALETRMRPDVHRIAAYLYRYLSIKGETALVQDIYSRILAAIPQLNFGPEAVELSARAGLAAALIRASRLEEARSMVEAIGQLGEQTADITARALYLRSMGQIEQAQGNFILARELHTQAHYLSQQAGDAYGETATLANLGLAEYGLGHFDTASDLQARALVQWRSRGDVHGETSALINLGNVEALRGNYDYAARQYEQALALARGIGNRSGETNALIALGYVERKRDSLEGAAESLHAALSLARELGDRQFETAALGNLAAVELQLDNIAAAGEFYAQALKLALELGHHALLPYLCIPAAAVIAVQGTQAEAQQVLRSALAQLEQIGYKLDAEDEALLAQVRTRIGHSHDTAPDLSLLTSEQLVEHVLRLLANSL
jgi:tetratricopeptide (TPR) repeat protein